MIVKIHHLRSKLGSRAALIGTSLLGSAALSHANVLVSENFSYGDGGLSGQNGGTGFGGNTWIDTSTSVSGGVAGGAGDSHAKRNFAASLGTTGTIWVRFDWGNSEAPAEWNSYGGLTFYNGTSDGGTQSFLIGNPWAYSPTQTFWNISGGSGDPGTGISNTGMKSGVAKLDLGAGTVSLWVGATGATIVVGGAADASVSGLNLANIQGIRINGYSGNSASQSFDNLLIGTTMDDVNAADTAPVSGTWTNLAGGQWATAGNWLDNLVGSGSGNTGDFSTLNITADTAVDLDSPQTIGNLVFGDTDTSSAAGWTLSGNILTLAGTTPSITVNVLGATKTATISAVVAGTEGLTKSGPGTLTLSAANTYSGATTINNGTLVVSDQPYFNIGRTTTVASGAVLELNNSNNTFTSLMPVSTVTGAGTFRLSGNSTINQADNGTVDTRLTFAMQVGGWIDLQGSSRLTNGGWQELNWTANQASMNIASGATLDVWDGQNVIIDALTGSGTVDKVHGGNSPRLLTVGIADGSGTFSGTIQNTGGQIALTKVGSGTQILTGNNTYDGATTITAGTLQIGDGGTTGTLGSGAVSIASGATLAINRSDDYSLPAVSGAGSLIKNGSGTLTLPSIYTLTTTLNAGTLKASSNQAFGATGTSFALNDGSINLNGYSQTIAAVTGSASSSIQGGTGLISVLTLGSGNASSTFAGALSGNLALVKIGTGTLTLSGSVAMNGIITVQEGTLDLSAATLAAGTRINTAKLAVVKLPTASISKLYVDNVKLAPGRWGAPGSVAAGLADFESPAFSGSGVVTVANTGISNMERWKSMKHGFFVHYVWDGTNGPMRPDGSRPTSIDDTANSFDAPGFADDMAAMGVEYVIFTAWQANFFPLFPSSAMNKYHSGRTPTRDMVGDMITAVRAKGIRVLLYTHPYQPIKYLGTYPNQYADLEWNDNLINDVYAELVDRYGDRIDGLFVDENFWQGNQDEYVNYDRLSDTIRRRNPELVLMHNWGAWSSCAIYTTDMTHRETPPGADLDANPWVSETTPVPSTQLVGPQWSASVAKVPLPSGTTAGRSAEGIFRTAVLGAGSCTSGGGWIWGAGPYSGDGKWPIGSQTFVGRWEKGVLEAMQGAAAYIAPVAASIKNTYPSTSWLTEPYTYIGDLPQGIVATRSTDDPVEKEYIHVLNPPGTRTLNLPLPADGKVFTNARLMKSPNRAVTITRNTRGMSLTISNQDNWETLNTVIVMDVASPGERGLINNNDPNATYTGAWTYGSGRATTEYGQDVHETSTNGNYLDFVFNGTDIDLIGTCSDNRGTAEVYIDGVSQGSIDLYSASTAYRRTVFSKSGLTRGAHTLKVVKTGGTYLTVDAFRVTEWINSNDPSLSYTGNWGSVSLPGAIGGEVRETSTNEDTVVLNFEGNGIDVIGSKGLGGGNVRYNLNSSFELAVPQSSNFEQDQALIYSSINSQTLSNGLQTLKGLKRHGSWADVDAFRIYKGSSTPALRWGASGGGGNGTWNINNSTNWYDGSAATKWLDFGGTDYAAIFGGTAGTVTLAANINVNRLTFQTTGYIVNSNALNLTGPPALITTPTGTTTINSAITGTASLVKAGPGTLKLTSATSTNTGYTTLNEGTLSLIGGGKLYSNLGWGSKTVSVNSATMLEVDQWDGNGCLGQLDYSVGNLVINGGTIRFTGNSNGTAEGQGFTIGALGATLQSDAPLNQRWNINLDVRFSNTNYGIASNSGGMLNLTGTGNGLISKVIPGNGGLTKSGAGTWSLTNTNTYTGDTTVNGGILSLGNGSSPTGLANTANVLVASGAKLNLNYTGTDTVNQLWLGGTRMPPNVYSSGNSTFITGSGTLTVNDVSASGSYTAWSGQFGYNLTGGTNGDDDNDGIENLLEYVLGGNPKAASSGILPTATTLGGNLVFTFRRIRATTADTNQVFQYGTNLSGWTDVPIVAGGIVAIQPDTPQAGTDTITITVPEGTNPRTFGRLKVSIGPTPP
jgi:autotransporter-associated beta strand protein